MMQKTIKEPLVFSGIGAHGGRPARLTVLPARADAGFNFIRSDLDVIEQQLIPARSENVFSTTLNTTLGATKTNKISTVEHLLSALRGMGVDNALIEVDGAEVPILDGSALEYGEAIADVGLRRLHKPRCYIEVLKPVRIECGDSYSEFSPFPVSRFEICIDYDNKIIGKQSVDMIVTPEVYRRQIAPARTFGSIKDVNILWSKGLALGSSLENAIVIDGDRILNPEGLRFGDEFVRHKLLDAIGDLALAKYPIIGHYKSYRGGHQVNYLALRALLCDRSAWRLVVPKIPASAAMAVNSKQPISYDQPRMAL